MMCGETRIPRDMCVGKHASLGICVWGNTHPGETRIPMTGIPEQSQGIAK